MSGNQLIAVDGIVSQSSASSRDNQLFFDFASHAGKRIGH
jgi:hypothetical protein